MAAGVFAIVALHDYSCERGECAGLIKKQFELHAFDVSDQPGARGDSVARDR